MMDPVEIRRDSADNEPPLTADEYMQLLKDRHARRIQWFFLGALVVIVIGALTPLVTLLTRLALGG